MKKFLICLSILVLSACAGKKGETGAQGPVGPGAPVPTVTPLEADIEAVVTDENDYRLGLGQSVLTSGLSCRLYTITGGDRIQSTIAGHTQLTGVSQVGSYLYSGPFNQPNTSISVGMNVLPPALMGIYKNMYLLRCEGQLVVLETDYYVFDLSSDDASVLYVGGAKVIDNDNNHGVTTLSGMKYLRRGVHAFRLDYAQAGGGDQALILKMDGASIDSLLYYH